MSTNTIVGEMIAEHDAKQRKQPLPTPKEVHARMIEMTNAANGLRYEVARFGDIERQLKAVHEKMEPLVLKAKELNDLVCERVSQASQPWADSRIHDAEELLQKVQQLEHENAALKEELAPLRETVGVRGDAVTSRDDIAYWCKLMDRAGKADRLERENAALREDRDRLDDVLASFYPAVAPLVEHYPVTPWEHMKDGRCRGSWAEDGSPYYFTVPHQLVPAFFALQRLAKLCRDKDAARAKEAQP